MHCTETKCTRILAISIRLHERSEAKRGESKVKANVDYEIYSEVIIKII